MSVMVPWTTYGCIAPYLGDDPTIRTSMSPFLVPAEWFVQAFGWTGHRRKLLRGFLRYRQAIWDQGHRDVLQWVGGSFLEHLETVRAGKPFPDDIDVVSLMSVPNWYIPEKHDALFDPELTKKEFHVDAYVIETDEAPGVVVNDATYWHGLFGHQRITFAWKGMLAIRLDPVDDAVAWQALNKLDNGIEVQ
jgi:hypothetical protein